MQNLEKRVAALESANSKADDLTIIRRYVRPGHIDAEIHRLRDEDGSLWMRLPGETEQDLIDRATREVKRNPRGIASLRTDDAEVLHPED